MPDFLQNQEIDIIRKFISQNAVELNRDKNKQI